METKNENYGHENYGNVQNYGKLQQTLWKLKKSNFREFEKLQKNRKRGFSKVKL